jgi:predicted permease
MLSLSYLDWYLENGAVIGIATAAVAMVWGDMRQHTGLISANPWQYIASYLQLVGLPIFVFGTHLKSSKSSTKRASLLDTLITIVLVLILSLILIIWLLVVVPVQYAVYLLCGAPGRIISRSQYHAIAQFVNKRLEVKEVSKNETVPDGWWLASIADKPVAITSLFSSLFFFIVNQFY